MKNTNYTEDELREREEKAKLLSAIRQTAKRKKNEVTFTQVCREIVASGTCKRHRGRLIDHFSASAYMAVFNAVKPENKQKLHDLAERNPLAAISFCFKCCK